MYVGNYLDIPIPQYSRAADLQKLLAPCPLKQITAEKINELLAL